MKVLLLSVCCLIVVGCSASDTEAGGDYVFRARVANVVFAHTYTGIPILAPVNSNFVIILDNVQPLRGPVPSPEGGTLAYAIHSPVMTFMASQEEIIGQTFEFTAEVWPGPIVKLIPAEKDVRRLFEALRAAEIAAQASTRPENDVPGVPENRQE